MGSIAKEVQQWFNIDEVTTMKSAKTAITGYVLYTEAL